MTAHIKDNEDQTEYPLPATVGFTGADIIEFILQLLVKFLPFDIAMGELLK